MVLSYSGLAKFIRVFNGMSGSRGTYPTYLDVRELSHHQLADLNLPPEVQNRLATRHELRKCPLL